MTNNETTKGKAVDLVGKILGWLIIMFGAALVLSVIALLISMIWSQIASFM